MQENATRNSNSTATDPALDFPRLCRYFCERSPQAMVAVEGGTYIVRHVNAAFLRLAGTTRDAVTGRPFTEAVPEDATNHCLAVLQRVFRTGTPETLAEQRHGTTPGVYWSYSIWAILGHNERPVGLMLQVTEATKAATFRQQATAVNESLLLSGIRQQELTEKAEMLNVGLEAAIKAKDRFVAVLSHELRNPLNPVLAIATMLREDPCLSADTRQQLDVICRNAELAARLIDDLLDVTRIEQGKVEMDRRQIDLRTIIRRARDDCMPNIEVRELELDVDLGAEPYWIDGDAGRLQQVFWNLLKNAVKFTQVGGCVGVRCRRDGEGSVVTEVSDNGEGIDAESLDRIFNAFDQADRSITRQFGGLGLGLTISRSLIEMHGGSIRASSAGKGRGSTFTVRLPLLPAGAEVAAASPGSKARAVAAARPLRILLVEDHGDTARIMRRLLSARGHEVQVAGDVATALQLAAEQRFDLLLSDLGLPDGSGLDLMRTLRARGLTLPAIALSGYGQETDQQASREAGFTLHLVKPVNMLALAKAIARVTTGAAAAAVPV